MTFLKEQQLEAEIAVFWDEFARHLPKSKEREALGEEKICNAFRAVYTKITTHLRTTWLRSEIEKLEGMKQTNVYHTLHCIKGLAENHEHCVRNLTGAESGWNAAITSIITRYKEELKVLESK